MKKLFALTVAFAALVAVGCAEKKPAPAATEPPAAETPADPAAPAETPAETPAP